MIVGCYAIHLYCAGVKCAELAKVGLGRKYHHGEFTGRTERQAKAEARKAGWRFLNHDVYCKTCAKR